MMENILRYTDKAAAHNVILHCLNDVLNENGISCNSLGLPEPSGDSPLNQNHDQIAQPSLDSLNNEQLEVFRMVTATDATSERVEQQEGTGIYVDAPGGSGKIYQFKTLHAYLISNNIATSCAAWTSIIATLLTGGKTLHSLFKLPVPLTGTSVCVQCSSKF